MRLLSLITLALVAVVAAPASADKAKRKHAKHKATTATTSGPAPGKGFWKILVQPKAKRTAPDMFDYWQVKPAK